MDYRKLNRELAERIAYYAAAIRSTFYTLSDELVSLAMKVADSYNTENPFRFDDYPQISKKAEKIFKQLRQEVYDTIVNAEKIERRMADVDTGLIAAAALGAQAAKSRYKPLFASKPVISSESLHKFAGTVKPPSGVLPGGSVGGEPPGAPSGQLPLTPRRFGLSDRVWDLSGNFRDEIQRVIDAGIREGLSADGISKQVQQYLREPERWYRRFKLKDGMDEEGNPVPVRVWKRRIFDQKTQSYKWINADPKDYHPGQGVYRSSYKNAMRLARTEINMAYHEQAHARWLELDFIVGFRVVLSGAHPVTDLCDDLQGEYPKEFKFTGWHPQCMCHTVALIKGEDKEIDDVPENFKKWVSDNGDRIETANNRGTLPYFLKDNAKFAGIKVHPKNFMERTEIHRIEANRAEYERLKKDGNYVDVRFNPKTGALSAIHKEHKFDPTIGIFGIERGKYERISLDVLYKYGRSIVLGSEKTPRGVKAAEGILDGKLFDIKGVEGTGSNNIINNIKDASKKGAKSLVLYYHDKKMFSRTQISESYNRYFRTSKSKRIKTVYYIVDGKLYLL